MHFIKPKNREIKINGEVFFNDIVNLDQVLSVKPMTANVSKKGTKEPSYFTISFFNTPKEYISWYYETREERNEKYSDIMDYIRTHQKNINI